MFPYIDHIKEKIKKGADGMLFEHIVWINEFLV